LTHPTARPSSIITTGSLAGPTTPESQLLKPYPQFTGVTRMAPAFGNSHYEAGQFQLEKRMSSGVTALIAYTVAKNISDFSDAGNAYNRQAERSLASSTPAPSPNHPISPTAMSAHISGRCVRRG
jgi:hypothetical protein